jgi:hypothetical protein
VGAFYSDLFSMTEKVGDYIINVSEALAETNEHSIPGKPTLRKEPVKAVE